MTLDDRECQPGGLPMLCIVCGRPADVTRPKLFLWRPAWTILFLWPAALSFFCVTANAGATIAGVGPLLFCLWVPIATTRSQRVWTPLCPDHVAYWSLRAWFLYGGAVAVVGSAAGAAVVLLDVREPQLWLGYALAALPIAWLAWVVAAVVLHAVSVRTGRIADGWIELHKVHVDFAQALARQREGAAWHSALDTDRRESRPA